MMRVGSTYRAFINGCWLHGLTYEAAARLEAEDLAAKTSAQRDRGVRVIVLTGPAPKRGNKLEQDDGTP